MDSSDEPTREHLFPNLASADYEITSPATRQYNGVVYGRVVCYLQRRRETASNLPAKLHLEIADSLGIRNRWIVAAPNGRTTRRRLD